MTEESAKRAEVIKHLGFIHNIIDRMGLNSFFLKGWSLTIVAALIVLVSRFEGEVPSGLIIASVLSVAIFAGLDGYYLWQERLFRGLYDEVRQKKSTDFSMEFSKEILNNQSWCSATFSGTIVIYYVAEFFIVLTLCLL